MKRWAWLLVPLLLAGCAVQQQEHTVYLPVLEQASLAPPRKGIGMHNGYEDCAHPARLNASWHYDWGRYPPTCTGSEAVPMLYNASQAGLPIGGNSEWVMWFNEPDVSGQANLSPQQAANLYNARRGDYLGTLHVSPSVADVDWLADWLPLVDPKPDALGVHVYGVGSVVDGLVYARQQLADVTALAQQYGIAEIWVTEWALVSDSKSDQAEFMHRMFLEVFPDYPVTRVAWFIATNTGGESWALGENTSLIDFYSNELTLPGIEYSSHPASGGLVGDLTGDGCVDILDLSLLCSHFGECE